MEEQYIGSYKVLKQIGAGGMAKVYLAVHKDVPNLKVILKILSDPRLGERFRQEADKLALLDGHPNICRINHFFSHGEDTVIVMEYINGSTLDEILKKKGHLPVNEAIRIVKDVLGILSFAHRKGVAHRDIKPSNIMLDSSGKVKVIDFGIAKGESDPNLTAAGMACGTPAYMAPEQFTPSENTNYNLIDIYAVGTTLFHFLTGTCPYTGDNEFAIRDAKLFNDPPSPRSLNADIPKPLEKIILKCLSKEPADRFGSTDELLQALDKIHIDGTDKPIATEKTESVIDSKHPVKPPSGIKKPAIIGIAVVVLAVIVFGAIKMFSGNEQPKQPAIADSDTTNATQQDTTPFEPDNITGQVLVTVTPRADAIYFDDSLLEGRRNSASIVCDTGQHVLKIKNKKATNKVIVDTINISAGQSLERPYTFIIPAKPKPPKPAIKYGHLIAASLPRGADVYIDGVRQPQKTVFTFKVKAGSHIVSLRLNDKEFTDTVKVAPNSDTRVFYEF